MDVELFKQNVCERSKYTALNLNPSNVLRLFIINNNNRYNCELRAEKQRDSVVDYLTACRLSILQVMKHTTRMFGPNN